MNKYKKIALCSILVIGALLLLVWACLETDSSDNYQYEGYILAIQETDAGTVLTTLRGDTQSEFTVKWYTKEKYNGEIQQLREGDCIKLSTTRRSDTNIKKFSAYSGFSMEGKIVYMEGLASPFLLTTSANTKAYRLYGLISSQASASAPQAGTQVKVYYQYPLNAATVSIVVDIIQPISDTATPLTEAEIAYITSQDYTVSAP